MFRVLLFLLIASLAGCGSVGEEGSSWQVPNLSIGSPNLKQNVIEKNIAEGVDFYDITRGNFGGDSYILSSGILNSYIAGQYLRLLDDLSIQYSLDLAPERAPQGTQIGEIIRIKNLKDKQNAEDLSKELQNEGLIFNVVYSAQEGHETTGPFKISLLKIDLNKFDGRLVNVLANKAMQGAERVSAMSSRKEALAGINGGYFAFNNSVGDYGAPAGIYVEDGVLLREASNDRAVLILDNSEEKTNITFGYSVRTELFLEQGDKSIQLNGINRVPGLLLNCGGYESWPLMEAAHDFLCKNDNEVIAFNRAYGDYTPEANVTEVVVSADGDLVRISESSGTKIEDGYTYIQFPKDKYFDLNQLDKINLIERVYVDNKEFKLKPGISMISAGPTLILDGMMVNELRVRQGWNPYPRLIVNGSQNAYANSMLPAEIENREAFYGNWVLRRHPRTAIGLTSSNILFWAVVYGRNPGVSEGATVTEMSYLMQALGVNQALNLDGGGSSVMVLKDQPTGPFSDPEERRVSDAILLVAND